jgi:hypothetical protein
LQEVQLLQAEDPSANLYRAIARAIEMEIQELLDLGWDLEAAAQQLPPVQRREFQQGPAVDLALAILPLIEAGEALTTGDYDARALRDQLRTIQICRSTNAPSWCKSLEQAGLLSLN